MMAHLETHLIYADAFQMSPSEATAIPAKPHGIVKEAVIKAVNPLDLVLPISALRHLFAHITSLQA